jgi:hypothetical protein
VIAIAVAFLVLLSGGGSALAAPPANDDFDQATVIGALPFSDSLDTTEATPAADDPSCSGDSATVWYRFTAASDGAVEADTFGSSYDTTLSVYTGTRGNLSQVACNDDSGGDVQSQVHFATSAGTTYYLMVSGFDDTGGGQLLLAVNSFDSPPANDDFDGATVVGNVPFADTAFTFAATTAVDDPSCFGNAHTAWYRYTPVADGVLEADTFGSSFDTTLSAYTGARGSLTQLACDNDAGGPQSQIEIPVSAGTTYYLMVGSPDGAPGGSLDLNLSAPAGNDDFDQATPVGALPFTDSIDTSGATAAPDDPNCFGDSATVWYRFTAPANGTYEANTFDSNYDTTLSVYAGSRGALTQIACNDDAGGDLQSEVQFAASGGTTYYLMVSGYDHTGGGSLVLHVDPPAAPPANDDFDQATDLGSLPAATSGNSSSATSAPDDPSCFGNAASVWYRFTAPTDTTVSADTFGSGYDTTLSAYTGARGSLDRIACANTSGGGEQVSFPVSAGTTYYLMIASAAGAGGGFQLQVREGGGTWDLTSDFRRAPDEQNPNPDSLGNTRVWHFMKTLTDTIPADQHGFTRLGQFTPQLFGIDGLEQWHGAGNDTIKPDRLPGVGVNATGQDQQIGTLDWPADTIRLRPGRDRPVVVDWQSPLTAPVTISCTLTDLDPDRGDGVRFTLVKYEAGVPVVLASGSIPNRGSGTFSVHRRVHTGANIYLIVDDGGSSNALSDSTALSFTVTA